MNTLDGKPLTRRNFLRYSGLTIGGAAYAGLLGPIAEAVPAVTSPDLDLSPRRRATFAGVIGAVGSVVSRVDPGRADEVVTRLNAYYRTASPESRETLEVTLDAVEASIQPGEFHRRSVQDRVAILRAGITGVADPDRGIPGRTSSMQSILTDNAVALAATSFFDGETRWNSDLFLAPA